MQFPTHVSVNAFSGEPLVLDAFREITHLRHYSGEAESKHLSVYELKWRIYQKNYVPPACQSLIYGTEVMIDSRPIAAYGNGAKILYIDLVASLNDVFRKMDWKNWMEDGWETYDALENLENAVQAFKSKPGVQEEVLRRIRQFLKDWPSNANAMRAFIAWSNLDEGDLKVIWTFVSNPTFEILFRFDVIDKLFQSLPPDSNTAVDLFNEVARLYALQLGDVNDIVYLNKAMQSFLLSVQNGNTHALGAVYQVLSHQNVRLREWAVRLFAKLAKEGNPMINKMILHKLACEESKLSMLKAMARLAGSNFSQVLQRMNHAIESGEWIPERENRDSDFLHCDSSGHILISGSAALALRVQKGDTDIISRLLDLFLDVDWKVKTLAVEALLQVSHIGCDRSVHALVTLLQPKGQDTEAWVNYAAINALSTLASNVDDETVNAIVETLLLILLHDDSPWVQCAAMSALPFLDPSSYKPGFDCVASLAYVKAGNPWTRFAAVCALSVWSERGVYALSEQSWIELSTGQDPWVRYVAEKRLETGWSARMAKSILGYKLSLGDGGVVRRVGRRFGIAQVIDSEDSEDSE